MQTFWRRSTAKALLLVLASTAFVQAQQALDSRDPLLPMTFTDLAGAEHRLPCTAGTRGLVLIFINIDCPIANSYHPMLGRLKEEFADSRFDFAMVHADADLKLEAGRKHQSEYEITWPVVLDPGNKIARRVSARVTPEAIIVDAQGQVLYRGRIDDRHQDYGRKRPAPTTNDLQIAMSAISQDKPVPKPETKPVGCVIRYAD